MQELKTKLLNMKNATQQQYREAIETYSKKEVIKELSSAGLSREDLSDEEFQELLEAKVQQATAFSKGLMVAGGAFMFLELLG